MAVAISSAGLWCREADPVDIVVAGARVVDPLERIDETLDVTIEGGMITALEPAREARPQLLLTPGFIDPHVHLRSPGREDEEDLASGTAAAAAGGYCAILAMPNTDPVIDSAAVLGALVDDAKANAEIPVGFFASITRGLAGEELTDMVELAEAGAVGFTDDGRPVVSAGLMRRALQYSGAARRVLSLHEEEPTLTGGGHMHEGAVSAELGIGGWPSIAESLMVERDIALAQYESRPVHFMHLSALESVEALRRSRDAGIEASGEVSPHHLCLTDEVVRRLDTNLKMNPPLRAEADRQALIEALCDGTIEAIATDHAPHALHEKELPFEEAPFGVTGLETAFSALYSRLVATGKVPLDVVVERMTSGPARIFGLVPPRIAVGEPANVALIDVEQEWLVGEDGFRSLSANSWLLGERLKG
ncbi:MAG: dihydroorotase, partial [Gaiellaceae bacterium]